MARRRGRRIRLLGMRFKPMGIVIIAVLAFLFIAPFKNMVLKLFGKTPV